ncbi:transcriptional regulator [Hymenobacter lapidarius]|uniref:Transcriptional regulator n=1 Tax=Hymenobacter lapidarius TaxID=1908237 RepID=A0A1G1SY37_9BACT|nr:metalloregulator ArsR/SmtB family transcription factor [Hymenobacter lapidarius]OGX83537.1 transcriptional regulator [Hymenobacter lapidarius]
MNSTPCVRVFANADHIQQCQARLTRVAPALSSLAAVLALAGNEVRLQLLFLLADEQLCVCDLADVLRMTVSAVSQHLRKLKDGGLVTARKVGQTVFYSLNAEHLPVLQPLLARLATTQPEPAQ